MKVLEAISNHKSTILRIIIALTTIASYIYILKRLFISGGRNQLLLTIDVYTLSLISCIFCSEFLKRSVCDSLSKNFPMIKNNSGRGVIYVLISIIYMCPQISSTNHYTKYFLLLAGIICYFMEFKMKTSIITITGQIPTENNVKNVSITTECKADNQNNLEFEVSQNTQNNLEIEVSSKKEINPYDYPEDF